MSVAFFLKLKTILVINEISNNKIFIVVLVYAMRIDILQHKKRSMISFYLLVLLFCGCSAQDYYLPIITAYISLEAL